MFEQSSNRPTEIYVPTASVQRSVDFIRTMSSIDIWQMYIAICQAHSKPSTPYQAPVPHQQVPIYQQLHTPHHVLVSKLFRTHPDDLFDIRQYRNAGNMFEQSSNRPTEIYVPTASVQRSVDFIRTMSSIDIWQNAPSAICQAHSKPSTPYQAPVPQSASANLPTVSTHLTTY
jgi:hypothetical protein